MELSIFLAKLIGLYYLIIGIVWVVHKDHFDKLVKEMLGSRSIIGLSGVMSLLVGLAIAIGHPIWHWNWQGLISLLGYIAIIQGVVRIAFTSHVQGWSTKILGSRTGHNSVLAVLFILGIFLTYNGFAH